MALQEELEQQGNWLFRHRSYLPLIPLIIAMAVYLHAKTHSRFFFPDESEYELWYRMFAVFVGVSGLAIRAWTVGFTPENTSGRNTKKGQVADSLNTTGIYSIVRHPLYLGNFLMWLGIGLWTQNIWFILAFSLFYWIYYERIMFAEEQFLRKKFKDEYVRWAETTPAFFPRMRKPVKPTRKFNWKKILKKEKNGLFALFFIFCLFDITGEIVTGSKNFNLFLIIMCALSGIGYIVLRYLKKNTTLLNNPA